MPTKYFLLQTLLLVLGLDIKTLMLLSGINFSGNPWNKSIDDSRGEISYSNQKIYWLTNWYPYSDLLALQKLIFNSPLAFTEGNKSRKSIVSTSLYWTLVSIFKIIKLLNYALKAKDHTLINVQVFLGNIEPQLEKKHKIGCYFNFFDSFLYVGMSILYNTMRAINIKILIQKLINKNTIKIIS